MRNIAKFESQITDIHETSNPQFAACRILVCYTGLNRNNSFLAKEDIEKAIPTIYDIPIIGEHIETTDNFGSHGGQIIIDDKGFRFVDTTKPYGVVSSSSDVHWEMITDDGGVEREWLVVDDALLWKARYEDDLKIFDEYSTNQSMEIEITDSYYDDDKVLHITGFNFSGLCILGISKPDDVDGNVEPCFEMASIATYALNKDSFKEEYSQMKNSLKKFEDDSSDTKESIEIDNSKDAADMTGAWGSVNKSTLRKKIMDASNVGSLVKEAYLIVDSDFEDSPSTSLHYPHHVIKDGKLVVHKKGLEAAASRLMANDPNNKKAKAHLAKHYKALGLEMDFERSDKVDNKFAWTSEQLEDELRMLLGTQKYTSDWGYQYSAYWFVDYLPDQSIVIAEDSQNYYLVGMNYTVDGDKVSIDFDSCKRFKVEYIPMELQDDDNTNNSQTFSLMTKEHMEYEVQKRIAEKFAQSKNDIVDSNTNIIDTGNNVKVDQTLDTPVDPNVITGDDFALELEELKQKNAELEAKNKELEEFKLAKEQEERKVAEEALFAKFAGQFTEDETKELREHASEFSLEELETKMFALAGKKAMSGQFSLKDKKDTSNKVPVFSDDKASDPYGGLIEKYASNK